MHASALPVDINELATTKVKILDLLEVREPQFVARWQKLSENARVLNPFWDPGFCLPALHSLSDGEVFIAAVVEEDGTLAALAPFCHRKIMGFGPKVASLWTHDFVPLGTPLVSSKAADTAFLTLLEGIIEHTKAPILASSLKRTGDLGELPSSKITTTIISEHQRAAIVTDHPGERYRCNTLSRQRRQGLDRRFRRLAERTSHLGPLEIKFCHDPELVPSRFEEFMRLERLSWKGTNKTALLSNESHAAFAREAALSLSQRNACTVATLQAGETVLSALTLFHINGEFFSWKTSFDETYRECSVGVQILARFTDEIRQGDDTLVLDSCTSPDNETANAIWSERNTIQTVLFHNSRQAAKCLAIKSALQMKEKARQTAKSALRR